MIIYNKTTGPTNNKCIHNLIKLYTLVIFSIYVPVNYYLGIYLLLFYFRNGKLQ